EDCAETLRGYCGELNFDGQERDLVEQRLDVLHRLTSKYGADTHQVLAYREKAKQELSEIENADERIAALTRQLTQAEQNTRQLAEKLSAARQAVAVDFSRDVMQHLAFLDMPGVHFSVSIRQVDLQSKGADEIEFLIAANPGEPPRPIAKIASGGELSRIMLAIQSLLADVDDIDTLVFDEIDSGISGRAAVKVGIKLKQTATGLSGLRSRQVLCVTHLAQIAAGAHNHLLITKAVENGRTFTRVIPLDQPGREAELSRIISGEVTPAGLTAAREMMEQHTHSY
ncbi:MAG: DNA repair protein RecN, partial [Oscillospiraceae bacterium]|nr:DNA repair protein RecN [Oscillospiraceae bacterium]